jgi:acyl phosphate:glycerol-3-phosphate acyltransferase
MPWIITALAISYLIGSIPWAYIFVRLIKNQDIRKLGSGNVGATNAARVLGKPLGILILVLDTLKGFVVVLFLGDLLITRQSVFSPEILRILLGVAAILGHSWTVFLNFKGGKGVATTLGVLVGLSVAVSGLRPVLGLAFLGWVVVFAFSRIVSLASVAACIFFPVLMFLFKQPVDLIIVTSFISAFIILRHKSNIKRLLSGKEKRF